MNRLWKRLFWIWTVILFTLTSYPKLPVPTVDGLTLDKVAHFLFYLVFAYFYYRMKGERREAVSGLLLLLALIPVLDEAHQLFIPGRTFSWWDALADALGMGLVIGFAVFRNVRAAQSTER